MFPRNNLLSTVSLSWLAKALAPRAKAITIPSRGFSVMRALEPRVMLDAAIGATIAGAADAASGPDNVTTDSASDSTPEDILDMFRDYAAPHTGQEQLSSANTYIFVDRGIDGFDQLIADLSGKGTIVVLESDRNGLEQIAGALHGKTDIDSVHIFSHGTEQSLTLGSLVLSTETIEANSAVLQDIGVSLDGNADIMLYGCSFGQQSDLINTIADLTGADIASSLDYTGDAALNGNWDLEIRTGSIETTTLVAHNYRFIMTDLQMFDFNGEVTFDENDVNDEPQLIDSDITLSGGSGNFEHITITVSSDGREQDILGIKNFGTGASQIGISGSNITYEGTIIGTFTGGTNGTDLVISLNSNSSLASTEKLIESLTYANEMDTAAANRTVTINVHRPSMFEQAEIPFTGVINAFNTPTIVSLPDGGYVTIWYSYTLAPDNDGYAIHAQRYDSDGVTVGSKFVVNSTYIGSQQYPTVAQTDDGGFVVIWNTSGGSYDIYGQKFDANCVPVGTEFLVGSQGTGTEGRYNIVSLNGGGFAVVWPTANYENVFSRSYDTNGVAIGSAVQIDNSSSWTFSEMEATGLSDGTFIVTWVESNDVKIRKYNADGTPASSETSVGPLGGTEYKPAITTLTDGRFVVVFQSYRPEGAKYYAQIYNNDLTLSGPQAEVGIVELSYRKHTIVGLADGGYVVVWQTSVDSQQHYWARRFDENNAALGGRFHIDTFDTTLNPSHPRATALADGGFAVSYSDPGGNNAFTKIYDLPEGINPLFTPVFITETVDIAVTAQAEVIQENDLETVYILTNVASTPQLINLDASLDIAYTDLERLTVTISTNGGADDQLGIMNVGTGAGQIGVSGSNITYEGIVIASFNGGVNGADLIITFNDDATVAGTKAALHNLTLADLSASLMSSRAIALLFNTLPDPSTSTPPIGGSHYVLEERSETVRETVVLSNGNLAVIWTDNSGIFTQIYDTNGDAIGPFVQLVVESNIWKLAATETPDGGFVVSWPQYDGTMYDVYAQKFDGSGAAVGAAFVVKDNANNGSYPEPDITVLTDGNFVITWYGNNGSGLYNIYGQRYDANCNAVDSIFQINTSSSSHQQDGKIKSLPDGGFIVVWEGYHTGSHTNDILFQRYDANGDPVGAETVVNTITADHQENPRIAVLDDGKFVITWIDKGTYYDTGKNLESRIYNADGSAFSAQTTIKSSPILVVEHQIISTSDGGYLIIWNENYKNAIGQKYTADGQPHGTQFVIPTVGTQQIRSLSAIELDSGKYLVSWQASSWIDVNYIVEDIQPDTTAYSLTVSVAPIILDSPDDVTYEFTEEEVNTAPQILHTSFGFTTSFTSFDGLTITVDSSVNNPQEQLAIRNQGTAPGQISISGSDILYEGTIIGNFTGGSNGTTLTIVFNADATHASVEALLTNLTYANPSNFPILSRDIAMSMFMVPEEILISHKTRVLVESDDDIIAAPVTITDFTPSLVFGENTVNAAPQLIDSDITLNGGTDDFGGSTITISISDGKTQDQLGIRNQGTGAGQIGISGSNITYEGTIIGTFTGGQYGTTMTIELVNVVPPAAIEALIENLTYANTSDTPAEERNLSISFTRDSMASGGAETILKTSIHSMSAAETVPYGDGFIASWIVHDDTDTKVLAQIFDEDGTPLSAEILVDTVSGSSGSTAKITVLSEGNFAIVWSNPASGDVDTYIRHFNSDGQPYTPETRVNSQTVLHQGNPSITTLSDGSGYVVTWEGYGWQDNLGVYAKVYNNDGTIRTADFIVNQGTSGTQHTSSVTALAGGDYLVTWLSSGQVLGRIMQADGTGSAEFFITPAGGTANYSHSISASPDGSFTIVISGYDTGWNNIIKLRQYGTDHQPLGPIIEFIPDGHTYFAEPTINLLDNGDYFVTWYNNPSGPYNIYGQRFDSDLNTIGASFAINPSNDTDQSETSTSVLENGSVLVLWRNASNAGDTFSIQTLMPADEINPAHTPINVRHTIEITVTAEAELTLADTVANLTFTVSEASSPVLIDTDVTLTGSFTDVSDVTVIITTNGGSGDQLSIHHAGTGVGQIGVSGSDITYEGVVIGTFTGGVNGTDLVLTMNSNASMQSVEALIESLTFYSTAPLPTVNRDIGIRIEKPRDPDTSAPDRHGPAFILSNGGTITNVINLSDGSYLAFMYRYNEDTGNDERIAQRFDEDGSLLGGEFLIDANGGGNRHTSTTLLQDGRLVLTWLNPDNIICAGIYDSSLNLEGPVLHINPVEHSAYTHSIAALDGGGFVITWDAYTDLDGQAIYAQKYNSSGDTVGSMFLVHNDPTYAQDQPKIHALDDGSFLISFSKHIDSNDQRLTWEKFDANFDPVGSAYDTAINFYSGLDPIQLSNGNFLVAYEDPDLGNAWIILDENGQTIGSPTELPGNASFISGAAYDDGGFILTWRETVSGTRYALGQRYDQAGNPVGDAVEIATSPSSFIPTPLHVLADGRMLHIWRTSSNGITRGQIIGDALPITEEQTIAIKVMPISLSGMASAVTYMENTVNAAPQLIDADITLVSSLLDHNGLTLKVETDSSSAREQLGILNIGNGAGQVGVTGSDITYEGTIIASFTGGVNGDDLVIVFNSDANSAAVEAVTEALTYGNTSNYPAAVRNLTISFYMMPNDVIIAQTVAVTVTPEYDAPVPPLNITGFTPSLTFGENLVNSVPQLIDSDILLTGGNNDFNEAVLTLSSDGGSQDTLGIRNQGTGPGQIGVSGSDITYEGTVIATFTGGNGAPLVITLNAFADNAGVETLIENLTYANTSDTPTATRNIEISLQRQALEPDGSTLNIIDEEPSGLMAANLPNGGYILSWKNINDGVSYLSAFDSSGNEMWETGLSANDVLELSVLEDGKIVIAWRNDDDLNITVYNADGTEFTAPFIIGESNWQFDHEISIAPLENGGFVASWVTINSVYPNYYNISAQIFDADGNPVTAILPVNEETESQEYHSTPSVSVLSDGGFVVVWNVEHSHTGTYIDDILGQKFDSNGNPVGSAFIIASDPVDNSVSSPQTVALSNGNFAVTWEAYDGDDYDIIYVRVYDENMNAVTDPIQIAGEGNKYNPIVTSLVDGSFIVAWDSETDTSEDMWGQRYSADGTPLGPEFIIKTNEDNSLNVISTDQGFMAFWDSSGYIAAQKFILDSDIEAINVVNTVTINVTPEPDILISNMDTSLTFLDSEVDGTPQVIDSSIDLVLAFDDLENLSITISTTGGTGDQLGVRHQGNGAGQIGVSGSDITYEGTVIGSFTGGTNGTDLVITFNTDASVIAIEALIENLTFAADSNAPVYNREISIELNKAPSNSAATPLEPYGEEFQIGALNNDWISNGTVFHLANGDYIVLWTNGDGGSYSDIYGQRFDSDGNPIGNAFIATSETSGSQETPVITELNDGTYVMAWFDARDGWGQIYARHFDANFDPIDADFRVDNVPFVNLYPPSIAPLADGGFVVTWVDQNNDAISAQRFNAAGVAQGPIIDIQSSGNKQVVAAFGNGFVVGSYGEDQNGDSGYTFEFYDENGDLTDTKHHSFSGFVSVDITALPNGGFAFAACQNDDAVMFIYGADGEMVGAPITIPSPNGAYQIVLSALTDGSVFVVVDSYDENGNYRELYGQRFDSSGNPVDEYVKINAENYYTESTPQISVSPNGNIIVTWSGDDLVTIRTMGAQSLRYTHTVDIAVTPIIISDMSTSVTFQENTVNAGPQLIDTSITLETSLTDFEGVVLTIGSEAGSEDNLAIHHQGNGAGQIGVSGANISYGGTVIGTFTGGTNGQPLVITLDADASPAAVEALLENLTYANTSDHPALNRNITISFDRNAVTSSAPPVQVGTPGPAYQSGGSMGILPDGGFIVVWSGEGAEDDSGIYGQRYDANKMPVGTQFAINTTTAGNQETPSVAVFADGSFVVTWESDDNGSDSRIYAQRFDSDGDPSGTEFTVNTSAADTIHRKPVVETFSDGRFLISWYTRSDITGEYTAYVREFDASGSPLAADIAITTPSEEKPINLKFIALPDGDLLLTWSIDNDNDMTSYLYTQRFDSNGDAVGSPVVMHSIPYEGDETAYDITVLSDGGYVVIWNLVDDTDDNGNGGADIAGQRFDSSGNAVGNVFKMHGTVDLFDTNARVTALEDGKFVVMWMEFPFNGGDPTTRGQVYNAHGAPIGKDFSIVSTDVDYDGYIFSGAISMGDGSIVVALNAYGNTGEHIVLQSLEQTRPIHAGTSTAISVISEVEMTLSGVTSTISYLNISVGTPQLIDSDVSVTTVFSDFENLRLTVETSGGANDQLAIRNMGTGAGQVGISGSNITYGGTIIGTFTGGTNGADLIVTFNNDANALIVEAVIENLTFANNSGSPSMSRDITISLDKYNPLEPPSALGNEVEVAGGGSYNPSIAILKNGGYVITWYAYDNGINNIYGRIYNADGVPGSVFLINATDQYDQYNPSVTAMNDGGFVVAWNSWGPGGSDDGTVYGQRYDASGDKTGPEFTINTTTGRGHNNVSVVTLADDSFVVTWEDYDPNTGESDIFVQRFDSAGSPAGSEFFVGNGEYVSAPTISSLSSGGFVITWINGDGFAKAQIYDAGGVASGAEIIIQDANLGTAGEVCVTGLSDGRFIAVWTTDNGDYAQVYDAGGNPIGTHLDIGNGGSYYAVNTLSNGGFVIANDLNENGDTVVVGQAYDENGGKIGSRFYVAPSYDRSYSAQIASLPDGSFIIAYMQDGNGVYTSLFGPETSTVSATVEVNITPILISDLVTSITFNENTVNNEPQLIDADITLDSGVTDYDKTTIIVKSATPMHQDNYGIRHEGTGAGQIGVSGSDIMYEGTIIGTFKGGADGQPLVITLNGNANTIAVENLIENLTYANSSDQPVASREVSIVLEKKSASAGEHITLNDPDSEAYNPSSTPLADGGFLITWHGNYLGGDYNIYAQRYDVNGDAVGTVFMVNTSTGFDHHDAQVSSLDNGGFVIIWRQGSGEVYAQIFDADCNPVGSEFQAAPSSWATHVTGLENGGFVVSWSYNGYIFAQIFDENGNAVGSQIDIASGLGYFYNPDITALDNGNFAVSFTGNGQDSSIGDNYNSGCFVQVFDSAGNAVSAPYSIATEFELQQNKPDIAAVEDGFIAVWGTYLDNGQKILGQKFDNDGNRIGTEFLIANGQYIEDPKIVGLPDGGFLVAFYDGAYETPAFGQIYDANGKAFGRAFTFQNNPDNYVDNFNSLSVLNDGRILGTWGYNVTGMAILSEISDMPFYTSASVDISVTPQTEMTLADLSPTVTLPGSTPQVIDSDVTLNTFFDDFENLVLTVSADGSANDQLGVRNVGTGAGQIGVSGSNITYEGTIIATFTGGTNGADLIISFTDDATNAAVEAVLENLTYFDSSGAPTVTRDVTVELVKTPNSDIPGQIGAEFTAVTSLQDINSATTIPLANGGTMVIWQGENDNGDGVVFSQRFDAAGNAVGGIALLATYPDGSDNGYIEDMVVVKLKNGGFVIASEAEDYNNNQSLVYYQLLDADGNISGSMTPAFIIADFDQEDINIATLEDGGFVISWSQEDDDGHSSLFLRTFDASGNPLGQPVNLQGTNNFYGSSLTHLEDGGYIVSWYEEDPDTYDSHITVRKFDSDGNLSGPAITINSALSDNSEYLSYPVVSSLEGGGFVVSWFLYGDNTASLFARQYDSDGQPTGPEFNIAPDMEDFDDGTLQISALSNGGYMIVWNGENSDIYGQAFDADGNSLNNYFVMNTNLEGYHYSNNIQPLGNDSFILTWVTSNGNGYTIHSQVFGLGATETITQTIEVTTEPDNEAPTASDSTLSTNEDTAGTVDLFDLVADTDSTLDFDSITIGTAANGTVSYNNTTGIATYTPNANWNGTDSFTYTVNDGEGGSVTKTITVTVDAINDAPTASDSTLTTDEDTGGTIDLLALAADIDTTLNGGHISVGTAANGTVSYNSTTGVATYTPNADWNGTDSFTYTVNDGAGGTITKTITVTVTADNDAPTASDSTLTTDEDTAGTIDLLALAADIDTTLNGGHISVGSATNGTISYNNSTGVATYTPNANWNGTDSFTYTVNDGAGGTVTKTISVTVNAVNDAPTASNSTLTTDEDTAGTIDLFSLAADIDSTLTYSSITIGAATNGTVLYDSATGIATYTPNTGYNGNDSFTYTVNDSAGGTVTRNVTVTVSDINDIPTGSDSSLTIDEDTAGTIDLFDLAEDTDNTLDFNSISVGSASNGTVTYNNTTGIATYTPNTNWNGTDSFTYTINDGAGGSVTKTITVTVSAVNDAPTATDSTLTTDEDTAGTINLLSLSNDIDTTLNGGHISVGSATNGTVSYNSTTGVATYTPNANWSGSDSFTYTVNDAAGGTVTRTISVTVDALNDAPTASDSTLSTDEDTAGTIDLFGLASDIDNSLTYSSVTVGTATNGTVSYNNTTGIATYTPNADWSGSDSFTYTVDDGAGGSITKTIAVTVNAVNDGPSALDSTLVTDEDTDGTIDLLGLASDIDTTLNAGHISIGAATNGTVSYNSTTGIATYTPDSDWNGTDSFTYTVNDGLGGSVTKIITVTVNAVNDAPTASDLTITTDEDTAGTIDLLALSNDIDTTLNGGHISVGSATNGAISYNNTTGVATYTPNANWNGTDSFTYTVNDGAGGTVTKTINVTVNAVNDAPTASDSAITTVEDTAGTLDLLALASDIDTLLNAGHITVGSATNGTVSYNSTTGIVTYTPDANWSGTDSFTYTVDDGAGGSITKTITVTVTADNDAPTASDSALTTDEDTAGTIDLLSLTSDIDTALSGGHISVGTAANGSVSYNSTTGVATYTPNANWNGTDSFTYTVNDGAGGSVTKTITVTVTADNDAPTASDSTLTTNEDIAGTINLLSLSADIDTTLNGGHISVGTATNGTVSYNSATGIATYTPNANWNGTDSFTYTVNDGAGGTVTKTITVTVNAINDAPTASDSTLNTTEDTNGTIDLLALSADIDTTLNGGHISVGTATNGTVSYNSTTGVATYTPNANWSGTDSFTYTVNDGAGGTVTKTITVTVTADNDDPTASDSTITTTEDTAGTINLLALSNDIDTTLNGAHITVGSAVNGTVSYNSTTGVATYTPDANWNGTDSFTYTVNDGAGGSATHAITVTVTAVNDAPTASDSTIAINEDTAGTINLFSLAADIDSTLNFSSVTVGTATNGTVSYNSTTGVATYTPNANWNGTNSFTYTVNDGAGGTVTKTITVMVVAGNDAPTASDSALTTDEDTAGTIDLLALAADIDTSLNGGHISVGTAAHGSVSYNSTTGVATYTPNANWNGTDSFTYTVNDGAGGTVTKTITVTVNAVNDAPTAANVSIGINQDTTGTISLFALATDVDNTLTPGNIGIGSASNGTVTYDAVTGLATYTPAIGYTGADSFTYTISDGQGGSVTRTINVTVSVPTNSNDISDGGLHLLMSEIKAKLEKRKDDSMAVIPAFNFPLGEIDKSTKLGNPFFQNYNREDNNLPEIDLKTLKLYTEYESDAGKSPFQNILLRERAAFEAQMKALQEEFVPANSEELPIFDFNFDGQDTQPSVEGQENIEGEIFTGLLQQIAAQSQQRKSNSFSDLPQE